MLKSAATWFRSLSKAGKAGFLIASVLGLGVVSAATGSNQPRHAPPKPPTAVLTHKTVTTTETIPFATTNVEDATLAKGTTKITTVGVKGVRTHTFDVTYSNGVETSRKELSTVITAQPVAQVTSIGTYVEPQPSQAPTSSCNPNYNPCVPNVSYDLDCPDIGQRVTVTGYDQYRLDADHDGIGCESY